MSTWLAGKVLGDWFWWTYEPGTTVVAAFWHDPEILFRHTRKTQFPHTRWGFIRVQLESSLAEGADRQRTVVRPR